MGTPAVVHTLDLHLDHILGISCEVVELDEDVYLQHLTRPWEDWRIKVDQCQTYNHQQVKAEGRNQDLHYGHQRRSPAERVFHLYNSNQYVVCKVSASGSSDHSAPVRADSVD